MNYDMSIIHTMSALINGRCPRCSHPIDLHTSARCTADNGRCACDVLVSLGEDLDLEPGLKRIWTQP